jgi:hypothetical protein
MPKQATAGALAVLALAALRHWRLLTEILRRVNDYHRA